jgi:NADH-quinone oxidoreductase subunit J|tara:strand:+ start:535 stop:1167 length:633 start_codon:yes stop_codon:yes gene_type:complete
MLAHTFFFYFFSTIAVFSAVMVIVSRNTVNSVFFLILVFVSISVLFIMIGAEFLGMIMLIVYVGAVAVLFLFVVMMLNVNEQLAKKHIRKGLLNNMSVGSVIGAIIFVELLVVIGGWKYKATLTNLSFPNLDSNLTNTQELGQVLYTDYIHLFQISGMILLIAMIGAITLTFKKKENVKRQNYFTQISREKSGSVSLVDVETGKGVKIDD